MQEAIDECYDRIGRYLKPNITDDIIQMGSGNRNRRPYQGQCVRTDLHGLVIDHKKSESGVVPTLAKLLWMVGYQDRINRSDGRVTPYRLLGSIALLPKEIVSTIEIATSIPGFHVVENTKALVKRVLREERYLFLCFGKNTDRIFGNGLRYSCGSSLEINGETRFAGFEFVNQMVDFAVPLRLAAMNLDWDNAREYFYLRDLQVRGLLTDEKHKTMIEVKSTFGQHAQRMVSLSREATRDDLRLAKWLSQ